MCFLFDYLTKNIYQIITVVHTFDIQNAVGKKIHIYDHLNTRVDVDDTLKYLLRINSELLVLKVVFIGDADCDDLPITSEVIFC